MTVAPTRFVPVDWVAETDALRAADAEGALDADGLARLGLALELTGRRDEVVPVWDRAQRAYLASGDREAAARCVYWIGFALAGRGEVAQAGAWAGRLAELTAGEPPDSPGQALLLSADAARRFATGDLAGSVERFQAAASIAEQVGDADVRLLAEMGCGRSLVALGEIDRGFGYMDRAMLGIATGEVGDLVAGAAFCAVIASCLARRDIERAREWTTSLSGWCDAQGGLVPYRGQCMLHRATLLQVGGAWPEAEATVAYLMREHPAEGTLLGNARYREAELLRLTGRTDAAERAYRAALEAGHEVQPGLGLLRLAQGRLPAARAGLARALDVATTPDDRADLLEALVEVSLALGDRAEARAAATALRALADLVDTSYLRAQADRASGCVLLAEGNPAEALRALRKAWAEWRAVGAPYEAARTRVSVAVATRALGDEDAAGLEFDAARSALTELGAVPDVERIDAAMAEQRLETPGGHLTAREVEVLRLVARGRSNREIAEQLFLSERTVARHVGNILAKLQLANRSAATAFAYEHGIAAPG